MSSSTPDSIAVFDHASSEDEITPDGSVQGVGGSRTSSHGSTLSTQADHVVHLSSIEHCMPRAYIRICFAYTVPNDSALAVALRRLQEFIDKAIKAKPYLAGTVVDVVSSQNQNHRAEIRFTTEDYLRYPPVEIHDMVDENGVLIKYADLDHDGLPPSKLRPEDVSALPPNANPRERSPVFRVRANIFQGGLIVSFYLHHCISDGTGFDLLTSGDILADDFTFQGPSASHCHSMTELSNELRSFAQRKSALRNDLSYAPDHTIITRHLKARHLDGPPPPTNPPGRGCILTVSAQKIATLIETSTHQQSLDGTLRPTANSMIMALLWRHMTRARLPSIESHCEVTTSKLMVPADIRRRLAKPLPAGYFGAAVDSAKAEMDLETLASSQDLTLQDISHCIRKAVEAVDDSYVRQVIAFANKAPPNRDVQDIQASNMDRVRGADMYITSWLKLRSYQHDLGMGLGGPDWVRKPWSRDPGSCIILPQKSHQPDFYEVVVQMTEVDMERLLSDQEFMHYIIRVID